MPRRNRTLPLKDQIKQNFKKPGHPTAFSAPGNIARTYNISQENARKYLEEIDSYVTHREYKRPSQFNPYFIHNRRKLVQSDLIDIMELSRFNNGIKYLLLIIEVFSRKIWVYPLKNKSGPFVRDALIQWLNSIRRPYPEAFATDAGREFLNREVRDLLNSNNIRQENAVGTCKAAIAERANKSLQVLIYKYLSETQTKKYIDKLQDLVKTYNKRGHRTLDYMSPNEADLPRNEERVRGIHAARYAKIKKKDPKFTVGQIVRIKLESKALAPQSRAYKPQFKEEYFIIDEINTRLPIPMYKLKAMNNDEEIIGGFYSNELTAVRGDEFKIEEILDERGDGPDREVLVRWMHFGPRWDSWIPASNIRFFRNRRIANRR